MNKTEEEVRRFAKKVYGSTTYSHKMKLVAWNDNYVLMQKPPSTEYIGRMSGSVYSESIWVLVSFDADENTIRYSPKQVAAFYKEGKLLKEEKIKLEKLYGIILPKKERNKKITKEVWVIIFNKSDFWNTYREGCFKLFKLLKSNGESILALNNKGNEVSLSKHKHQISYFKDAKEALNSFLKMERLAKEHKILYEEMSEKIKQVDKIFSENATTNE
jgi:hypothetical protein